MGRLDDKIAIVTGAGQGIGKAIAGKLAADEASFVTGQTVSVSGGLTMN